MWFSEIDHLEKNIKDAKETNLSFALDIQNANARNEQLVSEYNDLEAKTNQAEIGKFRHESNIREKDGAILRNQDIIRAVRLRISQLESESQGTIHILRKHLYITKLNLLPNFLQKEFVFQHNILTKFSCSNLKFLLLITCSRHRNLQNIRTPMDQ